MNNLDDETRITLAELDRDDPLVDEDDVRVAQDAYEQQLRGDQR